MSTLVLGAGHGRYVDGMHVDIDPYTWPDVVLDLNHTPWPFEDQSFSSIIAHHIIEHMREPEAFLAECHRVLEPGGRLQIDVPAHRHYLAWANIQHRRAYAANSFDSGHYTMQGWRLVSKGFRIVGRRGFLWNQRVGLALDRYSPVPVVSGYRFNLEKEATCAE